MAATTVLVMRVFASLSCVACLRIIILFAQHETVRKTVFNRLIFFICVSDLFSSVGMLLGHPSEGSAACWIQGILTNLFPVAGVFWTTLISYMLCLNIYRRKVVDIFSWKIYCFCWTVPAILTILPLTTNTYGTNGRHENGWCFIAERSDSPEWTITFWVIVSFYFWMWSSMLIYFTLLVALVVEVRRIYTTHTEVRTTLTTDFRAQVVRSLQKFVWYPINVLICWSIPTVFDILVGLGVRNFAGYAALDALSDISPTLLGLMNVVAFVRTNKNIRNLLYSWVPRGRTTNETHRGDFGMNCDDVNDDM